MFPRLAFTDLQFILYNTGVLIKSSATKTLLIGVLLKQWIPLQLSSSASTKLDSRQVQLQHGANQNAVAILGLLIGHHSSVGQNGLRLLRSACRPTRYRRWEAFGNKKHRATAGPELISNWPTPVEPTVFFFSITHERRNIAKVKSRKLIFSQASLNGHAHF